LDFDLKIDTMDKDVALEMGREQIKDSERKFNEKIK